MRVFGSLVLTLSLATSCAGQTFSNTAARADACRPAPTMGWQSLPPMIDRATLVVRADVIRIGSIDLGGTAVRTLTLRPNEVLKGTAGAQITVLENPCPFFDVRAGDDWIAFLAPYSSTFAAPYGPVRTAAVGDAYVTLGGPEAVFAVRNGTVARAGPLEGMAAQVVRSYEGSAASRLLADIRRIRPADGDVRALFARYGWAPHATWNAHDLTLPPAIGFQNLGLLAPGTPTKVNHNFDEFAKVSAEAGLDFRPHASKPGELIQILLERDWDGTGRFPPLGHAVLVDRRIVGAWVHVAPQGDLYAITQREAALAAPPHDPPAATATPNFFPQGINIARDHALANTWALSVKRPDLSGGQTQDRAVIKPIVEALDVKLPTQEVPVMTGTRVTIVLIWVDDRFLTFEYWSEQELLANRSFGYAVHPPRRAIELLEAIR